ncbi:uncharacterized protein [Hyperolius riggenbachi]|uniref:uncharacterized protein n=1 Tax=Hyperolius riggenbachi TaxID=752182 RepID=UPI0035A37E03
MSIPLFDTLLEMVKDDLRKKDTTFRRAVTPQEQLLITLRYIATGQTYTSLHVTFRIGKSTVAGIVVRTSRIIWTRLRARYMPVPDTKKWEEIAQGFWTECKFPNCVGALDGKHIRIQKPVGSGSHYFNYKKYFSIVLMAVADADYKFVYVDVGSYDSSNDSGIFQRTTLCRLLEEGRLRLPRDRPWPGTRAPAYPYVFVGDEAFALSDHVMRPYPDRGLDASQLHFNARLSRARRMVECTFGILVSKWRVFHTPMLLKPANAVVVVKAACILHNFVRQEERDTPEPPKVLPLMPLRRNKEENGIAWFAEQDTVAL